MERIERYLPLAGRILLSLIFLMSAFGKITNWSMTARYMASKGMPAVPFFEAMAILLEFGGAFAVLTGWAARLGALALLIFLIPATLIFHNFWAYTGMEQQNQMINFLKNLGLMGGLLYVMAFGPGPLSVDAHRQAQAGVSRPAPRTDRP